MAKKKKQNEIEEEAIPNYYDLKTDAVERLVSANEENSPEVPEEELKKYRGKSTRKIPATLIALFIKFWFGGAVCFFILWGLGTYISGWDMLFVMGFALGVVTDLLTNNVLRYFEPNAGDFNKWMMIPQKKFWTIFLNIPYAFLVFFCVVWCYNTLNIVILKITGQTDVVTVGVEPILFGLLYLGIDLIFLLIKNTMKKIVSEAKAKNQS